MKAEAVAPALPVGTIFEFDDGKHKESVLGVVTDVVSKSKEKSPPENKCTYEVRDKAAKTYKIHAKNVHIALPPNSNVKPSASSKEKMKDYIEIASLKPIDLGIDPDVLELAWELLADEHEVSVEDIMNQIDPDICETPTGKYRAFRLLSSTIGQIFFKRLHSHDYHHLEFTPKSPEKVQASKEKWCNGEAIEAEEWCML
jgi:hypothetical protein